MAVSYTHINYIKPPLLHRNILRFLKIPLQKEIIIFIIYTVGCLWEQLGSNPSRMGVSIEEYRQRIGCFVRVLLSFKIRGNNSNTCQKQSNDSGTALRIIIRCVDYAIKIQTGHCKHLLQQQAHLYVLAQQPTAFLLWPKLFRFGIQHQGPS